MRLHTGTKWALVVTVSVSAGTNLVGTVERGLRPTTSPLLHLRRHDPIQRRSHLF